VVLAALTRRFGPGSGVTNSPRRLLLILMAGVLLVAWTVTAVMVANDRQRIFQSAEAELLGAIPVLRVHARRTLDTAFAMLVAIDETLQRSDLSFDLEHLTSMAGRMQVDAGHPIGIAIVDANHRLVRIEGGGGEVEVGDRSYVAALRDAEPGQLHIDTQLVSRTSGRSIIPVVMKARPNVFNIDLVLAAIPADGFEESYRNLLISAPSAIGLLRSDGMVLHMTPDIRNQIGRKLDGYDLPALVKTYEPMTVFEHSAADLRGGARRTAYAFVDPFSLIVFTSMQNSHLERSWRAVAWPKIAGVGLATLVISLLSVWILVLIGRRDAAMAKVSKALHELDAANNAKRDFMARMSHELRTPMNAIIGFSELIAGAMFGPLARTYQEYGRDIHRSGQHLLGMINQLLDITRIESGALKVQEEVVDVQAVAQEVASILKAVAEESQISIQISLDDPGIRLMADRMMLRQMLINLISNAVKFSHPGGVVVLRGRVGNDDFILAVEDQGPGFKPEKLAHVFEPFGRGQSLLAARNEGIGLGLPITKALVELHGGRLTVDTEWERGSLVTLHFPRSRCFADTVPAG